MAPGHIPGGRAGAVEGLKQEVLSPPYLFGREPVGNAIFQRVADADKAKRVDAGEYLEQRAEIAKLVKPGSEEASRIGEMLDRPVTPEELARMSTAERTAYDWYKRTTEEFAEKLGIPPGRRLSDYLHHVWRGDESAWRQAYGQELESLRKRQAASGAPRTEYDARLSQQRASRIKVLESILEGRMSLYDTVPRTAFFGALERREGAEGYTRDLFASLDSYVRGALRKAHDEPAMRDAVSMSADLPSEMREYTRWFLRNYWGLETSKLKDAMTVLVEWEAMTKLGFNLRSMAQNLTQMLHTAVDVGPHWFSQGVMSATGVDQSSAAKAARQAWRDGRYMNDFVYSLWEGEGVGLTTQGKARMALDRSVRTALSGYQMIEAANRATAFQAGYLKALSAGADHAGAVRAGEQVMYKNQFRYGKLGTAKLTQQQPLARPIMQFTSFSVKTGELLTTWAKEDLAAIKKLREESGEKGFDAAFSDWIKGGGSKLFGYFVASGGLILGGRELGVDLGQALGIGMNPVEVGKTVGWAFRGALESLAGLDHNDWQKAAYHFARTGLPFSRTFGGGILPQRIGTPPVAGDVAAVARTLETGRAVNLLPVLPAGVQAKRLVEGGIAASKPVKKPGGAEYPIYGPQGKQQYTLTPGALALRTLLAPSEEERQKRIEIMDVEMASKFVSEDRQRVALRAELSGKRAAWALAKKLGAFRSPREMETWLQRQQEAETQGVVERRQGKRQPALWERKLRQLESAPAGP